MTQHTNPLTVLVLKGTRQNYDNIKVTYNEIKKFKPLPPTNPK